MRDSFPRAARVFGVAFGMFSCCGCYWPIERWLFSTGSLVVRSGSSPWSHWLISSSGSSPWGRRLNMAHLHGVTRIHERWLVPMGSQVGVAHLQGVSGLHVQVALLHINTRLHVWWLITCSACVLSGVACCVVCMFCPLLGDGSGFVLLRRFSSRVQQLPPASRVRHACLS